MLFELQMNQLKEDWYYRERLQRDFSERQKRNPRFSLRAYSAKLGCDPSALSRILSGKQALSPQMAKMFVKKLGLQGDAARRFLRSVADCQRELEAEKLAAALDQPTLTPVIFEVAPEIFLKIADVDALAVLESLALEACRKNIEAIAQQVNLPIEKVRDFLSLLIELGLVKKEAGQYSKIATQFRMNPNIAPLANRLHHQKLLDRAAGALVSHAHDQQVMNGVTMVIDPKRLPKARKLIKNFINELSDFLEQGEGAQVYQLGFQLFPLAAPDTRK